MNGAIPFVSSGGSRVLAEAVLYRVFKVVESYPCPDTFAKAASLTEFMLPEFCRECEPMDRMEWIKSMPSRRRKALIRANHALRERGEYHKDLMKFQAFVKHEHLPYFAQTEDGLSVEALRYIPRLINPPHDEAHLLCGPYLKPLIKRLKQVWHRGHWIYYGSTTPEDLDEWLMSISGSVSFFWSDYSAFDATYSTQAWDLIEGLYRKIYPGADPMFFRVLESWRCPSSTTRMRKEERVIKFLADVCNASGRDDTSLANAVLNGIALSMSIAAACRGKTPKDIVLADLQWLSRHARLGVVGDDSLVGFDFDVRPYTGAIGENLKCFGLVTKTASSLQLCDVTFLGMMPYPVGNRFYWGPTLGRRLYKAFWQCDPIGNLPAWTRGVAKQLSLMRHVPVLCELADVVLRCTAGHKHTEVARDPNRPWTMRETQTPPWEWATVRWLARRYEAQGLSTRAITMDLVTISRIQRVPCVVKLFTTDAALLVDDL